MISGLLVTSKNVGGVRVPRVQTSVGQVWLPWLEAWVQERVGLRCFVDVSAVWGMGEWALCTSWEGVGSRGVLKEEAP